MRNQGFARKYLPHPNFYFNPDSGEFRKFTEEDMRALWERSDQERHPRKVSEAMSGLQEEVGDDEEVAFYVTLKYKYTKTGADLQKFYNTRDLSKAAAIDQEHFMQYPDVFSEDLEQNQREYTVTVNTARSQQ